MLRIGREARETTPRTYGWTDLVRIIGIGLRLRNDVEERLWAVGEELVVHGGQGSCEFGLRS